MKIFRSTRSLAATVAVAVIPLVVAASAQSAGAADITNPAQHPYPIVVTIDGQTYHDGEDTLPGYDDYSCTPIPDVVYDFADNEILYYDDQGDLLAVAPWTEWSRISSYQTWLKQQQSGSGGSGSGGSGSSSSGSSGSSGSTGSSGSSGSSGSTGSTGSTAKQSRIRVNKLAGAVTKAPTSKSTGKYRITISTPSGKSAATGTVTLKLRKGKKSKVVTGKLAHGAVTVKVPKLARGSWNVAISWPGNSIYLGDVAVGVSIKVAK